MNIIENTLVFKLGNNDNFSDLKINAEIKHFIADLRGVSIEVVENIKEKFITFDKCIVKEEGSFVIVCDFSFDQNLKIVPTIQEAYDYIQMEEMERQLKL